MAQPATPGPTGPASLPRIVDWRLDWRTWATAVGLGLLGVIVTQDLDGWLAGRIPHFWHAAVAYLLNWAMLVIPILLLLAWRRSATRVAVALRDLQAAVRLREDLTHMLVHDLKSPLVTGGMALNVLARLLGGPEREADKELAMLTLASDSCRQAERMVHDILDVARSEAGQVPLDLHECNLVEVVRQAVQELRPRLEEGDVRLEEDYPSVPVAVRLDIDKIRRVVNNLLENALKFSEGGGLIGVAVAVRGGMAEVAVRDTGPGIPAEWRDRIFERYSQTEAGKHVHRRSVGLGLTFCKLAVEAHGGRIWAEDAPEQGSRFVLSLPLVG